MGYKMIESLGKLIILFLGLLLFFGATFIFVNSHLQPLVFFLALIVSIMLFGVFTWKNRESSLSTISITILLFLTVIFAVFKIAPIYYDFSYDGQGYHQKAMINLADGWNPLYDEPLNDTWIDHYAKGGWYIGAIFYSVVDQLEITKAFNLFIVISAFLLAIAFFKRLNVHICFNIPLSLVIALNPITVTQLFTNYNDGVISPMLVSLMIMVYFSVKDKGLLNYIVLMSAIMILSNIKFTAFGYAVIVAGIPFIYMIISNYYKTWWKIFKEKYIPYTVVIVFGFLLAVGYVGATSYVTNTIDHKHPFYPLAGEGKVDIMTANMPTAFVDLSWGEKLFISLFSETSNPLTEEPVLKNPFSISKGEVASVSESDTRIAGFGPLFAAALILSVASLLICIKPIIKRNPLFLLAVVISLLVSVAINPEAWWMRYVPQLWILVCVIILIVYLSSKFGKVLATICVMVLLVNTSIVIYSTKDRLDAYSALLKHQLDVMKEYSDENELFIDFFWSSGNKVRFDEYGIDYTELVFYKTDLDPALCEPSVPIQSSTARICATDPQLVEALSLTEELKKRLNIEDE